MLIPIPIRSPITITRARLSPRLRRILLASAGVVARVVHVLARRNVELNMISGPTATLGLVPGHERRRMLSPGNVTRVATPLNPQIRRLRAPDALDPSVYRIIWR